jgi:hypothetical protein
MDGANRPPGLDTATERPAAMPNPDSSRQCGVRKPVLRHKGVPAMTLPVPSYILIDWMLVGMSALLAVLLTAIILIEVGSCFRRRRP